MKSFLLLTAFIQVHCQGQQEYTVPVLGHGVEGETYTVNVLYQFVNPGAYAAIASVDTGGSVTLSAGDSAFLSMTINQTEFPIQSEIKNTTRVVNTNQSVTMQVITTVNGHSEGVQAIPNDQLGTEYYVSTFCALGGYCQMAIGSTVSGKTQVFLKLPAAVDEIGFCIKNGTWYSKFNTTITLVYPEVVQLETTHDLTGTRVYADNPVAVIVGSRPATGTTPMYHLAEQLAPVPEWGTEFFVRPVGLNTYGNIVHITSRFRRTYVTMDGFPTVELTGLGQTVKRRIELYSAIRIKASRPVQVMLYTGLTYATNETILNPGMTLVPATEHYRQQYHLTCQNSDHDDVLQLAQKTAAVVTNLGTPDAETLVPYTDYKFVEFGHEIRTAASTHVSSTYFSGIMTCAASAIFPLSILVKQTETCTATLDIAYPGDNIDNDCDGYTDEDYCFENKMFATSYTLVNNTFIGVPPQNESIAEFTLIKLRLRSCGDVKIELMAHDSTAPSVTGKLVISISKEAFIIYSCFPDCSSHLYRETYTVLGQADCDTLVPYWIVKTSTQLCMDVGPFPDFQCSNPDTSLGVLNLEFTDMFMFGLHSDAVFYYDWRCEDMVTNCWQYDDDLCANGTYMEWVNINCRKFCGICAPDSEGKMFAVIPPADPNLSTEYNLISNVTDSSSSVNGDTTLPFTAYNVTTQDGSAVEVMTSSVPSGTRSVKLIYTNTPSQLTVTATTTTDAFSVPVFPLDALGTEYMTLSFSEDAVCDVISSDGPAEVWKSTVTTTTYVATVYPYDSIQLSAADYVGTVITASRPVAVFCFYLDVSNPTNNFWAQLMPTSSWGTEYILPPLNTSSPSASFVATVRILTNRANTRIEIFGDFQSVEILAERGDYLDQVIDPAANYTIVSNTPVAIAVKYEETLSGATSVLIVPPVDNYMESAAIYHGNLPGPADFCVLGSDSTLSAERAGPAADGRLCYGAPGSASYVMSIFNDFSSITTGFEVYSHPVHQSGHLVKDLYKEQICMISQGSPGDGLDNDCDGLADEEDTCLTGYGSYNEDYDLDGAFGEDCLESSSVDPAVTPPAIPVCYRFEKPTNDSYCWTTAICPCSWVDTLNEYKNMTQEERDASNQVKIQEYRDILKIDETLLTATIAEFESAEDTRSSSTNMGYAGIVLLTLICSLVVFFDLINVLKYLKNRKQTSYETD